VLQKDYSRKGERGTIGDAGCAPPHSDPFLQGVFNAILDEVDTPFEWGQINPSRYEYKGIIQEDKTAQVIDERQILVLLMV
jgi:hypothetical protein